MELKEIEKQIQLITGCSSLESGTIMIFIESYGKEQHNQALEDAANLINDIMDNRSEYPVFANTGEPILNLKKH